MRRTMCIADFPVPVINAPYTLGSDVCAELCKERPFAAYYWDSPTHREFGLRSDEEGMDVSIVAQTYGGGGHAHAAGFRVPRDHELAKL